MRTSNQTLPEQRVRLDYIDALRGVAALMVIVCHSLVLSGNLPLPSTLMNTLEGGKFGVQLFFVISAFTIFYSFQNSDRSTVNFFIRRFFRIAPLYFIATFIYLFMYGNTREGIGLNLTFLHGFSQKYINSVPGGWSIGVEMFFYCLAPFLFKKINTLERALYFFAVTLLFSFILIFFYRKVCPSSPELESFIYFWLPNQLPVFGLGFILYFLTFGSVSSIIKKIYYPVCLLSCLVLVSVLTQLTLFGAHLVFAVASTVLIYLFSKQPFPGLVNNFTLFLGKISYSLYLSQYAALFILIKTGVNNPLSVSSTFGAITNLILNTILLSITTILLSWISYHVIELPFQKLGKKLLVKKPLDPIGEQTTQGHVFTIKKRRSKSLS